MCNVSHARKVYTFADMSVTIYKDVDYQGVYAALTPGFYSGRDLVGCPHQSTSCEDLDNAISSIRVDPNVLIAFADSHAMSASGGGARVVMGPASVSDLAALAMSNRISSILVVPFRAYDSAIPIAGGGATLYGGYSMTGRRSTLRRGDYPPSRLTSEEVKLPGPSVQSLQVEAGVVVILYNGSDFDADMDAVLVVGPTLVDDIDRLGMSGRVNSVRVLYSDPFDVPNRAVLALGSSRAYMPGGYSGATAPMRHYRPSGSLSQIVETRAPLGAPASVTRPAPGVGRLWKLIAIIIFILLAVLAGAILAAVITLRKNNAPHVTRAAD
jgi:hypothetical protein